MYFLNGRFYQAFDEVYQAFELFNIQKNVGTGISGHRLWLQRQLGVFGSHRLLSSASGNRFSAPLYPRYTGNTAGTLPSGPTKCLGVVISIPLSCLPPSHMLVHSSEMYSDVFPDFDPRAQWSHGLSCLRVLGA